MGGFYNGAYAQPLQRQRTYGTGQDMTSPDEAWDMRPDPASPTTSLGGPSSQPSRFRAFLGSLSQMGQPQQGTQQRPGILQGISSVAGTAGASTGGTGALNAASRNGILGLGKFLL